MPRPPSLFAAALAVCASSFAHGAFDLRPISLSGEPGLVTLDYFAWDAAAKRLWVPGGNTGSVIVLDRGSGALTSITGFDTAEFTLAGKRGRLGPSSIAFGEGVVYIGNRADSRICIVDAATLGRGECLQIASPSEGWAAAPDAIVYVAATKELWVTRGAPPLGIASSDKSLTILDASDPRTLRMKGKLALAASAEGFAVDDERGLFYTNLEESGETVAIDVRRRAVVARWKSGCDEARGLALDAERGFLLVACSSRVVSLDVKDRGKVIDSIDTGDGLDNIDYSASNRRLHAAASKAATLTIAFVTPWGRLERLAVVPTSAGTRGVVAGADGTAYVADPPGGRILVISPSAAQ